MTHRVATWKTEWLGGQICRGFLEKCERISINESQTVKGAVKLTVLNFQVPLRKISWLSITELFSFLFFLARQPQWARASSFTRFLYHTQRRTTVGRTPPGRVRPLADNTQRSQQTNIHTPGGIRTYSLSRRAAVDLCLRPCGH